ncbi:hypothetical protein V5738_15770 [Salinisphaera sp. SPP-AMP-43]|uniref:hypothetical protein n=1 Tax=Salinisphaera sp. SPP-AMP-43 TaxID=3121288 RepID=UPI003C6E397E
MAFASDSFTKLDVSRQGKAAYACALAKKIRATHHDAGDFGSLSEDAAHSEAAAIGPLIGMIQSVPPFPDDLGKDIMRDGQTLELDKLLDDLGRLLDHCEALDYAG